MSWKETEENYLLKNWKVTSISQITNFLCKSEDSVIRKAGRLGLDICKAPNEIIKKKWTIYEDQYMIDNYNLLPLEGLMKTLSRSRHSILKRAQYLNLAVKLRHWTEHEINYLEENWGIINIKNISEKLNRTIDAVSLKACQLSLREQVLANGYFLTPKYISEILNINVRCIYNCMANGLLKFRKFNVRKKNKYQITVDSFLDFLKTNPAMWNSKIADMKTIKSYYSSYAIGKNDKFTVTISLPNWLEAKIQDDSTKTLTTRLNSQWTIAEDKSLANLVRMGYSFDEISIKLNRTPSSIKSRFYAIRRSNFNNKFSHKDTIKFVEKGPFTSYTCL